MIKHKLLKKTEKHIKNSTETESETPIHGLPQKNTQKKL